MHRFAVPGTTTVLFVVYCPDSPIDKESIRETMTTAMNYMNSQLRIHGNIRLPSDEDPYNTPVVPGKNCQMKIESQRMPMTQRIPYHLTYGITSNALRGLFGFLYTDGHAGSAVTEVIDPGLTGTMEVIGLISLGRFE